MYGHGKLFGYKELVNLFNASKKEVTLGIGIAVSMIIRHCLCEESYTYVVYSIISKHDENANYEVAACVCKGLRHVHTMKVMCIGSELICIVCIHTECTLTAIRIECTFCQSTSIGGLKPV